MTATRWYVVAVDKGGEIQAVSVSCRSREEADRKRLRIVQNNPDIGYFVAYADFPEPAVAEADIELRRCDSENSSKKVGARVDTVDTVRAKL